MAAFSITSASPSARLDVSRRGRVEFTVSNTARRDLTARAHVVTEGAAQPGWFTIVGPQRDSPRDATHQFGVRVAVPADASAGRYRFRLDVVGVEDPDEYEGEGVWATVDVPPAPQGRRVPLPLLLAVIAVLVIAVVVAVILVRRASAQPAFRLTATATAFGTVPVGQGSQGSLVTVSNTGSADASVTPVFAGADPKDFQILANTCGGGPITPGSSCAIQVAFQPAAQGPRSATLTVRARNAPRTPALVLTGTGQGAPPQLKLAPPAISLNVPASTNLPAASVIVITNAAGSAVKISGTRLDDPASAFQSISTCDGVTLGAGESCSIAVLFVKTGVSPAPYQARLLISDDAPGSPQVIPLSGFRH